MSKTEFVVDKEQLEVRLSRTFAVTPERLWQAVTDPAQIPQWWGPQHMATTVETMEVSVGGKWRIVQTEPGGKEHAFRGEFKEIDEPRKLVRSFEYEPVAGHILIETLTLEPIGDGQTKMTTVSHFENSNDLEGMVAMDMEDGAVESYDRLATLVE